MIFTYLYSCPWRVSLFLNWNWPLRPIEYKCDARELSSCRHWSVKALRDLIMTFWLTFSKRSQIPYSVRRGSLTNGLHRNSWPWQQCQSSEWIALEIDPAASAKSWPVGIKGTTSWEALARTFWQHNFLNFRYSRLGNCCCKALSLGVICYAARDNWWCAICPLFLYWNDEISESNLFFCMTPVGTRC